MNRVKFDPATLVGEDKEWWDKWAAVAEKARKKALKDYDADKRPIPFKGKVWSQLKSFLLKKVFNGKCAYCDSAYTDTSFGDADHYRPKSMVTEMKNGKPVVLKVKGKPHPGYYWLAYDWRNLIPACQRCNSEDGKMNQFPIKGSYVTSRTVGADPKKLDEIEKPLLLHPYKESFNPDAHLLYGKKGVIQAFISNGQKDDSGQATIDTCNLKRGELETSRGTSQETAWLKFQRALNLGPDELEQAVAPYEAGLLPHSRAAVQYVALMWDAYRKKLERLRDVRFAPPDEDKEPANP